MPLRLLTMPASTAAGCAPTVRSPAGATTASTARPRRRPAASAPSAPVESTAAACGPTARSPAGAATSKARPRRPPWRSSTRSTTPAAANGSASLIAQAEVSLIEPGDASVGRGPVAPPPPREQSAALPWERHSCRAGAALALPRERDTPAGYPEPLLGRNPTARRDACSALTRQPAGALSWAALLGSSGLKSCPRPNRDLGNGSICRDFSDGASRTRTGGLLGAIRATNSLE